jgi:hypothetical protein
LVLIGLLLFCIAYSFAKRDFKILGTFVGGLGLLFVAAGGQLGIPVVFNNTQLGWLSVSQTLPVWRLGFYTPGDGGGPVLYTGSTSPCSLNSGNGDNGGQVKAPDGCWLLARQTVYDVRIWSADPTGSADSTIAFQSAFNYVGNNYPGSEITCGGQAPGTTGLKYRIGTGAIANTPVFTLIKPVKLRHCQFFMVSATSTTDLFKIAPDANSIQGWAFSDLGIYSITAADIWRHTFAFSDSGNSDLFIRQMEFREVFVSDSSGRTGNDIDLTASSSVASALISAGGTGYGNTLTGTLTWAGTGCSVNPVINVTTTAGGAISILNSIANRGTCDTPPSGAATWTPGGGLSAGTGAAFTIFPGSTGFFFTTTFGPNITFFRCVKLHNVGDSVTFIQPTVSWSGAGNCSFDISNSWAGAAEFSIIDPNLTSIGGMILDRVYGFHIRGGVFECSGSGMTSPHGAFLNISNSSFVDIDMVQMQGGPCGGAPPVGMWVTNSNRIFATILAGSTLGGTDIADRYTVDATSSPSTAISEIGGQYGGPVDPVPFTSAFGTCGTGTLGSGNTIAASYRWMPKTTKVEVSYTITFGAAGNGTCAGWVEVLSPFVANSDANSGNGREVALVGKQIMASAPGGGFAVAGAGIRTGGTGFGASATGTVTWSGAGCTVNPVFNVTTNPSGVITSFNSITVPGRCTTMPANTATTWTGGGGLAAGTGASFNMAKGGYIQLRYSDNLYPGGNNNVLEASISYNARR